MIFLYFIVEVVLVIFAISKYKIGEDIKQCKIEEDFDRIKRITKKKRKWSLCIFIILLLMSAFQSFDWFRACSPKSDFQTLLGQNLDNIFTGFLCFVNVAVAIVCVVFIIRIIAGNASNAIEEKLKERISKIGNVNSALENLEKTYGKVSDIIRTSDDDTVLTNAIIRFDSSQPLFCHGRIVPYKEIVKCESYSIPIHKTTTKTITKASTSSALGRAVVGGVIAGPVGAVIGGTTGKKNSETVTEDVIERWEHKAVITLTNNRVISIPITSFVNYYDSENKHIILTEQEVVIRIASIVNKAVDIKNGLSEDSNESLLLNGYDKTTYVCSICGNNVTSEIQPARCPTCGNTEFNIRYICSRCGYDSISTIRPDKCPICNSKEFRV